MISTKRIKKIIKNEYIFSLVAKCIMVIIGLAESVLLARYLGAELRGQLSYVYSMASTSYLIITFGMYTIYPFKRKDYKSIHPLLNEFMTICTIIFTGYFLILSGVGIILYSYNEIWGLIFIMLPLMGYDKVSSFVFMIECPNQMNLVTLIVNIIQCIYLAVLILFIPRNLILGVGYYLLGCVLKSIYFTMKLDFKVQVALFSLKKLWEYIKFGIFPMMALLLTTLNYRLDIIMLKRFNMITLSQIGIYSIGIGLSEKALLIPDAIKEVLLSKLAKGKGEEEVARVMRICFLASIITAFLINISSSLIINWMYGSEYRGADQVTYISVWGTTVMVFFKMISQYNVVQHKQYINVVFLLIAIGVNFVFNMILIPVYGINGAAAATVIGHLVSSSIFLCYFKGVSNIAFSRMLLIQKEDIILLKNRGNISD